MGRVITTWVVFLAQSGCSVRPESPKHQATSSSRKCLQSDTCTSDMDFVFHWATVITHHYFHSTYSLYKIDIDPRKDISWVFLCANIKLCQFLFFLTSMSLNRFNSMFSAAGCSLVIFECEKGVRINRCYIIPFQQTGSH